MDEHASTDTSSVDVVCNMLAVFIILALLSVMLRGSVTVQHRQDGRPARETVAPVQRSIDLIPYWDRHYIVLPGRISEIDLDRLANQIISNPRAQQWSAGGYEASLIGSRDTEGLPRRDFDSFRVSLRIDISAVERSSPPVPDQEFGSWVLSLRQKYQSERIIPTFHVMKNGMDYFSALHRLLNEAGIRYRWKMYQPGESIDLARSFWQFDSMQDLR